MKTTKIILLLSAVSILLGGCGRDKSDAEGETSLKDQPFHVQVGGFLADEVREMKPDAANLRVLVQEDMGEITQKNQQLILQGLQKTWGKVEVEELPNDALTPGLGIPVALYDQLMREDVTSDVVISLVGVPVGNGSLSETTRKIPLIAILLPGGDNKEIRQKALLPEEWILLRRKDNAEGTPSQAYSKLSSALAPPLL